MTIEKVIGGRTDPRVRRYVAPTRVLWTSQEGVAGAENLLRDDEAVCILTPASAAEPPGILLDFGRELHGGIRLDSPNHRKREPVRIRVRFGESASEAMGSPDNDHTVHDLEALVPWYGHTEIGNTGFRFVRIDLLDPETPLTLRAAEAVFLYRPLDYLGSFECNDERLNRIWETGAYTVHLCMQDHVWDGIKRDRLVWIGDLHPEAMVIAAVFGAHPIVRESLDYIRDRTPLTGGGSPWMNGISSYSLWWILCHLDWYRYGGDRAYLAEQRDYLLPLLRLIETKLDTDGGECLDGARFLEWPTSGDPTAIASGLQALTVLALRAGATLSNAIGESDAADQAATAARRAARVHRESRSKQANALRVLADMADATETNRALLAIDPYRGLSTFYGYYLLQARARAGDYTGCLDLIRTYWGGMLDMGATTFWEGFELDWMENAARVDELPTSGKRDIHADFGDWCYKGLRHSLCHGWAAGPTAWLMEHVLGISPAAPGFSSVAVRPNLAGLEWARGTFPTPQGIISVSHESRADGSVATTLDMPDGVSQVNSVEMEWVNAKQ
jgi:hypothetical protein